MISMCIGFGCLFVAVIAFQIKTLLAYILCGVSVFVAFVMFFNSRRVYKEKNANREMAEKAQRQLGKFLSGYAFKPDGDANVDFNKPFMLFDNASELMLCGMPLSECALIPYSKLLGVRLYGKGEVKAETEDFGELLSEALPEADEEKHGIYPPESSGMEFMLLLDDEENPVYEFEFVDAVYPKNSFYYRDELKRAMAYMAKLQEVVCAGADDDDTEIAYWEFEE